MFSKQLILNEDEPLDKKINYHHFPKKTYYPDKS